MLKKHRFTHVRDNLRGDVSGKRFSAHVAEGNVADVAKERLNDGTGCTDTWHCHMVPSGDTATWATAIGYCQWILPLGTITGLRHKILQRISATEQLYSGI